LTVILRIISR